MLVLVVSHLQGVLQHSGTCAGKTVTCSHDYATGGRCPTAAGCYETMNKTGAEFIWVYVFVFVYMLLSLLVLRR